MDKKREKRISKFLSYALRHGPDDVGIELAEGGWTDVPALLEAASRKGHTISVEELEQIVANNDKQRFALSEDRARIRANQGHSVSVEIDHTVATPGEHLFHGTVRKFIPSIREQGLLKGNRQHVHLSAERETAAKVGQRRGKPVILIVRAAAMQESGHTFYLSANGVWLTEHVPKEYILYPG